MTPSYPSSPNISVLMPVYNQGKYLKTAITSILKQSYIHFEFIIINDGSTDNSLKISQSYANQDPKIKIIDLPHSGIVGALNAGLQIAQGQYIARMDADDIALPHRLQTQHNYMEQHPNCVLCGTWVRYIDQNRRSLFTYKTKSTHCEINKELLGGNGGSIVHPSAMFKKENLDKVGHYDPAYQFIEDFDLYLKLLHEGSFYNIPEILLLYRQHSKSVNRNKNPKLIELKSKRLNEERVKYGLPCIASTFIYNTTEEYKTWAYNALKEKYYKSAYKYTILTLLKKPLHKHSWSFLSYCVKKSLKLI